MSIVMDSQVLPIVSEIIQGATLRSSLILPDFSEGAFRGFLFLKMKNTAAMMIQVGSGERKTIAP